jgi:hypothetical protein
MSDLLSEIEAFCKAREMTETAFGRLSVGDPHLVADLKGVPRGKGAQPQRTSPRRLWPETQNKIRQFIATYVPPEKAA